MQVIQQWILNHPQTHSFFFNAAAQYLYGKSQRMLSYKDSLLKNIIIKERTICSECLRDFILIMKKRYGKQTNWFKVIGGMTISVSIQINTFKSNLKLILKNSKHLKCIDKLTQFFIEPNTKQIYWDKFMSIIRKNIKILQEQQNARNDSRIFDERKQSRLILSKQKHKTSQQINQSIQSQRKPSKRFSVSSRVKTQTLNSFYRTSCQKQRKQESFDSQSRSLTETKQKLNDFIVMKKCSIHSKLDQSRHLNKDLIQFRNTTKTSEYIPSQFSLSTKRNRKNTFFWNYLKKKLNNKIC